MAVLAPIPLRWGGGFVMIELLYFSFEFFNFKVLQITLYSIYVLYALINVILMKKKIVYRTNPPPTLPQLFMTHERGEKDSQAEQHPQ